MAQEAGHKFVKNADAVADDRNWIARIQNELNCVSAWQKDWGFLAGGAENLDLKDATKEYSINEQISKLQNQLNGLQKNKKETQNQLYGTGKTLETIKLVENNIQKNPDLRALERKLPKEWKKKKWTAPEDPYDPLKDLFKKKK
ncbi:hypothetical protein ABPG72_011887 [Tetrahymena utriculariae]